VNDYQLPYFDSISHDPLFQEMRKIFVEQEIQPKIEKRWKIRCVVWIVCVCVCVWCGGVVCGQNQVSAQPGGFLLVPSCVREEQHISANIQQLVYRHVDRCQVFCVPQLPAQNRGNLGDTKGLRVFQWPPVDIGAQIPSVECPGQPHTQAKLGHLLISN